MQYLPCICDDQGPRVEEHAVLVMCLRRSRPKTERWNVLCSKRPSHALSVTGWLHARPLPRPTKARALSHRPSWHYLEPSWDHLGTIWSHLETILGHLGAILGPPRATLGPSWAILGPCWGHLRLSWGFLGPRSGPRAKILIFLKMLNGFCKIGQFNLAAILGHLGAMLGHLGTRLGHLGTAWGQNAVQEQQY